MEALRELKCEEVVRRLREDNEGSAGAQPISDDGSPVVNPGLGEFQFVATHQAQERMLAGHDTAERGLRLSASSIDFRIRRWRRGEQGSRVKENSVDVETTQGLVERAFARPIVEEVAMPNLNGKPPFGNLSENGKPGGVCFAQSLTFSG